MKHHWFKTLLPTHILKYCINLIINLINSNTFLAAIYEFWAFLSYLNGRKFYQTDQLEWKCDEYLELDLFYGRRECWQEQNKFMFLTSLSTKTQIGTFRGTFFSVFADKGKCLW